MAFFLATLLALAAGGCDDGPSAKAPPPLEIDASTVAEFCGMNIDEHPGPKGQIFVKDRAEPYWFASVHDLVAFTMLPEEPKNFAALYVTDMGKAKNWDHPEPGTWVEARDATFVIGSRKRGGMDEREAVPFSDPVAAQAFIAENGGRAVRFGEIPQDYVLSYDEPRTRQTPAGPDADDDRSREGATGAVGPDGQTVHHHP